VRLVPRFSSTRQGRGHRCRQKRVLRKHKK
jgi:hypothetical protein